MTKNTKHNFGCSSRKAIKPNWLHWCRGREKTKPNNHYLNFTVHSVHHIGKIVCIFLVTMTTHMCLLRRSCKSACGRFDHLTISILDQHLTFAINTCLQCCKPHVCYFCRFLCLLRSTQTKVSSYLVRIIYNWQTHAFNTYSVREWPLYMRVIP